MQIFSRQAAMMDALISHFADQMRRRKDGTDAVDNVADDGESLLPFCSRFYLFFFYFNAFKDCDSLVFLATRERTLIYVN